MLFGGCFLVNCCVGWLWVVCVVVSSWFGYFDFDFIVSYLFWCLLVVLFGCLWCLCFVVGFVWFDVVCWCLVNNIRGTFLLVDCVTIRWFVCFTWFDFRFELLFICIFGLWFDFWLIVCLFSLVLPLRWVALFWLIWFFILLFDCVCRLFIVRCSFPMCWT